MTPRYYGAILGVSPRKCLPKRVSNPTSPAHGEPRSPDPSSQTPDSRSQLPNPRVQSPDPRSQIPDPSSQIPDGSSQIPDPTSSEGASGRARVWAPTWGHFLSDSPLLRRDSGTRTGSVSQSAFQTLLLPRMSHSQIPAPRSQILYPGLTRLGGGVWESAWAPKWGPF